jgi:predicted permease
MGRLCGVVGILRVSFWLPFFLRAGPPTELWVPLPGVGDRRMAWNDRSFYGVARMRPDAHAAAVTAEMDAVAAGWVRDGFLKDSGDGQLRRSAIPLQSFVAGDMSGPLWVLLGAVGLVLLVACANVVNLVLVRADARRHEIVVRAALGAERSTLIRQSFVESLMLSIFGAVAGVAAARAGLAFLLAQRPAGLPRLDAAGIDSGVLLFTAGMTVLAAFFCGVGPALQSARANLASALGDASRSSTPGRARLAAGRLLVVGQLACSVVLVVGAVLLIRTLVALHGVELGFDPGRVLTAQIQLPAASYRDPADVVNFYRSLTERLSSLPAVESAGAVRVLPLSRIIGNWSITIEGRPRQPDENPNGDFQWATPGYFAAMRTTLVSGRFLSDADREDAPLAVVVNETMAERYWPGENALGKRFQMGTADQPMMTIVGIVKASRHNAFVEGPRAEMYLPHAQLPRTVGDAARAMAVVIRTKTDPLTAAGPLRGVVRGLDANLPLADVRTMDAIAADALAKPRFATWLLGLFALLALVLAAGGTYGTISLLVTARTREIGIRVALGAERRSVMGLILRSGLVMACAGIAIGTSAAFVLTRLLGTLLYGVSALDPATFVGVPVLLTLVALAACAAPARRAAALDPVVTIRER